MLKISPGAQENNLCFLEITKINDTLPFWASINPHHWFVGFAQSCVCVDSTIPSALSRGFQQHMVFSTRYFFFCRTKFPHHVACVCYFSNIRSVSKKEAVIFQKGVLWQTRLISFHRVTRVYSERYIWLCTFLSLLILVNKNEMKWKWLTGVWGVRRLKEKLIQFKKKKKGRRNPVVYITSSWKWCLKPRRNNSVLKFKSDAI